MGRSDLDAMMDNLEKAKDSDVDGAEKAENRAQRARKSNIKDTTDRDYKKDANYHFSCPNCDFEAYRKQARGSVRRAVKNPDAAKCSKCGHEGLDITSL